MTCSSQRGTNGVIYTCPLPFDRKERGQEPHKHRAAKATAQQTTMATRAATQGQQGHTNCQATRPPHPNHQGNRNRQATPDHTKPRQGTQRPQQETRRPRQATIRATPRPHQGHQEGHQQGHTRPHQGHHQSKKIHPLPPQGRRGKGSALPSRGRGERWQRPEHPSLPQDGTERSLCFFLQKVGRWCL